MYTLFAKHAYYPMLDLYKRADVAERLREAERNQRLPLASLRDLQVAKLRAIVAHATTQSAFYRARFADVPRVETYEDFVRLPLLSKADVMRDGEAMRCASHEGRLFTASTSGSTGLALRFSLDSGNLAWIEASQLRARRWWGVDRGDRQLLLWSRPVDGGRLRYLKSWAKYRLRNYIQFDTFRNFDDAKADEVIEALMRFRPRHIYGYGSSIGRVADRMARRGLTLAPGERPVIVEYTGDHMYEAERELAARAFGAPVLSQYGSSECAGVAHTCRLGRQHISIDHVLVEFLRPDGALAAAEETAEIVLTTLTNRGMPLIRYRVGDLGSYSSEPCGCGLPFPVMRLQAGKVADLVSTSTHQSVSAYLFDYINIHLMNEELRGIKQFLVEQLARDAFLLWVVKEDRFDPRSVEVFIDRMRSHLGGQIDVTPQFVEDIPLQASGKRTYFKRTYVDREQVFR